MAAPPVSARVPLVDLTSSSEVVRERVLTDVAATLESGAFTNGPAVAEFEDAFAEFCGVGHCVGVASGLDALRLALQALGVGPGDGVLVPAMTFVATWEAVSQVGATPVPVDVSSSDYCLDLDAVPAAISPRTRVVLPVHLYGQMADPQALLALGGRSGLDVLEDACQAHGASRGGRSAGSVGRAGAFSFYPTKNLGAVGDGGALVTSDAELAATVRALREHGQASKNEHRWIGWTSRLDTIQAAVLSAKLPYLRGWNEERRVAAGRYAEALTGVGDLVLPPDASEGGHAWHVYVVQTTDPVGLANHLRERGVDTGRHYPTPPHLTEAYQSLGYGPGDSPVAEGLACRGISLPLFPGIGEEQIAAVVSGVRGWFERG
jgi:dTDP-4-amino-4,6-dideoxygalactose transaminase